MTTAKDVINELRSLANPRKATDLQRFFKTGPGDYAEGDIFLGIVVPKTRVIAKKYGDLALLEIKKLTQSVYHEVRFCGLLILVKQFDLPICPRFCPRNSVKTSKVLHKTKHF